MRLCILSLFCSALLTACATQPAGGGPPPGVTPLPPPGVGPSTLVIPLQLDLDGLERSLDEAVPTQLDKTQAWEQHGQAYLKYAWQRDGIRIQAQGDKGFSIETTVHYQARVGVHWGGAVRQLTQCGFGETEPSLEHVGLSLSLSATADWNLKPVLGVAAVTPGEPCKVAAGIDVSGEIAKQVRSSLQQKVAEAQQKLDASLDLSPRAAALWQSLSAPHAFAGSEPGYLLLNPKQASFGFTSTRQDGNDLALTLGFTATPQLVLGSAAPATSAIPLPALKIGSVGQGLHLVLPIQIPYATLQQVLSQQMVGHAYSLDKDKEQVQQVTVYGSARSVVIRVDMQGSSQDTLYLTGTAVYDAGTGSVSLGNFDYTLDTQNRLQHAEEWLLHSKLRDDIQASTSTKLTDRLQALQASLQASLNRPLGARAALTGSITQMKSLGVMLADDHLTAYFETDGQLAVELR